MKVISLLFFAIICAITVSAVEWHPISYIDIQPLYLDDLNVTSPKIWQCGKGSRFIPNGAPDGKGWALQLTGEPDHNYSMASTVLKNPEKYAGKLVRFEAMVKLENVAPSLDYYGGAVLNLPSSPDGKKIVWPRTELDWGTQDWHKVCGYTQLPPELKWLKINIGIWLTTGTLQVANFRIYEARPANAEEIKTLPPPPVNPEVAKLPHGNGGTQRRGVQVWWERDFNTPLTRQLGDPNTTLLKELDKWNINLIRYELTAGKRDISTREKYLAWIDDCIAKLQKDLILLKPLDIKVVIDLHTGPGTTITEAMSNELTGNTNVDTLCEAWTRIAGQFKNNPQIYGYDLLNEPQTTGYQINGKNPSWIELAQRMTDAIRKIDPTTAIIVQISNDSQVKGNNIIYTEHFYAPHEFTHQFVSRSNFIRRIAWSYPGWINGVYYDKDRLRLKMKNIIDFQRKHQVKILLGEFGCIAWAPGAAQYLKDAIELFEEYGWDWAELDFADHYSGFSLTSITTAPETRRAPKHDEQADRGQVVKEALKKNMRN